jgi:hypothetical protein
VLSGSTSDLVAALNGVNTHTGTIAVTDTASASNANLILGASSGIVTATVTATGAVATLNTALSNAAANDALTLTLDATTADISVLNVTTGLNGKTSVSIVATTITSLTDTTGVHTIDLTTTGITWGTTISVTGGTGADAITLRATDVAKETVIFDATAANNGNDTIINFTAGTTKDILDFSAFLDGATSTIALSVANATGAAAFNNAATITAKANLIDTTNGVLATGDFAAGKAFAAVGNGEKGVVIVGDGAAKSIYYVYDSDASAGVTATITLVGTLDAAPSHADNFKVN